MNMFKVSQIKYKFTLIELIVVIGVIAILASLVLPNIKGVEAEAKGAALATERKSVQIAVDMYNVDHIEKPVLENKTTGELEKITMENPGIISIDKLYPEYLREFPSTADAKYWLDYSGKVWVSLVDAPVVTNNTGSLSWNAVEGAVEYIVYEYSEPNSNLKYNLSEVARVTEPGYSGTDGIKYAVQSVGKQGNKSVLAGAGYLGYFEKINSLKNTDNEESSDEYTRMITIDSTKIDEDLINYPIMVKLDSNNFDFSKVRDDGYDISFYDNNNNNLLDFEIDYFNKIEEKAVYHVRIPMISSELGTQFNIVYGDLGKNNDQSNPKLVWDEDYLMVQHMGEYLNDSTKNENDGTNYGTTIVESINGKGRKFLNNYINFGHIPIISNPTGNKFTVTIVNKYDNGKYLFTSGGQTGSTGMYLLSDSGSGISTNNKKYKVNHVDNNYSYKITSVIYNESEYKQFEDYNLVGGDSVSETISENNNWIDTTVGVPNNIKNNYFWNGIIDEIRISKIPRSDAWIKANDHNLRQNNLITIGNQQ